MNIYYYMHEFSKQSMREKTEVESLRSTIWTYPMVANQARLAVEPLKLDGPQYGLQYGHCSTSPLKMFITRRLMMNTGSE